MCIRDSIGSRLTLPNTMPPGPPQDLWNLETLNSVARPTPYPAVQHHRLFPRNIFMTWGHLGSQGQKQGFQKCRAWCWQRNLHTHSHHFARPCRATDAQKGHWVVSNLSTLTLAADQREIIVSVCVPGHCVFVWKVYRSSLCTSLCQVSASYFFVFFPVMIT